MADGSDRITLEVASRIDAISAADWDRCAGAENPFVSHAFLSALEDSGSVSADTGWLPQHLILRDGAERVLGVVPAYLKSHSYGEYVFDHGWADAYRRAGGDYYPKLQVAVPFSPVPGPRLLVAPDAGEGGRRTLIAGLRTLAEKLGVSGVHITFCGDEDMEALEDAGFMRRMGHQFHWLNDGYGSFDDFLSALASRKRKAVRKERREVAESGVVHHILTGDAIESRHWETFYRFYRSTTDRKWGDAYLKRGFFEQIGATMADKIALVMAEHDGRLVAGALNLIGSDTLYGRNWGCLGDYPFLHFETCYYQAIDFAIERGLKKVEAGAQGEHKLQRGYLPIPTWSAHYLADGGFASAVSDYLDRERRHVAGEIEMLMSHSPFRQEGGEG